MGHHSHNQKSAEQIRCIIGDHHKPVNHKKKQHDNRNSPKKAQFLTDDGKNHIILGFGKESQLLDAFAQSLPHQASGANGIKSLKDLEALSLRIQLRIQPCLDPVILIRFKNVDI